MWPVVMAICGDFWALREAVLSRKKNGIMRKILCVCYEAYLSRLNSSIPIEVVFASRPHFPHGCSGIFISRGASLGKDVVIFQQVTIGSNTLSDAGNKRGAPTIGNNVYIGAGAKIIGKITVGDNCRVGANACVYTDLPMCSTAVNAPTRIIAKGNLDNRFLQLGEDATS